MSKEQRIEAIEIAIDRGGGIVRFAKALGVTHQAVYSWKKRGWAPADRATKMEALFGVPRTATVDPRLIEWMHPQINTAADLL